MAKAKDWSKIYKKYKGMWVALADDEATVMGSGKTAKEAWEQAQQKGYQHPTMIRMPSNLLPYIATPFFPLVTKAKSSASRTRHLL